MLKLKNRNCKNAIAMSSSNEYVPYLSVYLLSIISNSDPKNYYDIVILESDITDENKKRIITLANKKNISIRFYNVNSLFGELDLYVSYFSLAKQCYYRLALGEIFNNYEKVIYTDIDIICNSDLYEFFKIPLKDYPIAACEEILWSKENRKGLCQLGRQIDNYVSNEVGCTDKYYNTGVMLINIPEFNKITNFSSLITVALNNKFINLEQCVLNKVFNSRIYTLNNSYNFEICSRIYKSDKNIFKEYMEGIENAKIYHYLTSSKVWFNPDLPKGYIWWSYARKTTFYEEILQRMIQFNVVSRANIKNEIANIYSKLVDNQYNQKLLYTMKHILYFNLKKYYYKYLGFAFGRNKEKYKKKYKIVKTLLKDANSLNKQLKRIRI